MNTDYDIIIAGGGMVGLSLALCLQAAANQLNNDARNWKILVVESFPIKNNASDLTQQPSFDARSTALAYGSKGIFKKIGVWQDLKEHVTSIDKIHISEQGKLFHSLMEAEREGLSALGYVVENAALGNVLLDQATRSSQIQFLSPVKVVDVDCQQGRSEITIEAAKNLSQISCKLLIVADGAQSHLRKQLGIEAKQKNYFQQALIANVVFSQAHQNRAFERFTEQGPLALLPLADFQGKHRAALVWTRETEQSHDLLNCDATKFLEQLQAVFGYRLGKFTAVGQRVAYPISSVLVEEQIRSSVVVMGNAAHFLHPVAGQGFNLSLRDCAVLAQVLASDPNKIGEISTLQAYMDKRKADQIITATMSDQLINIFSGKALPGPIREFGLIGLELLPGLKSNLVAQAAGLSAGQAQFTQGKHS